MSGVVGKTRWPKCILMIRGVFQTTENAYPASLLIFNRLSTIGDPFGAVVSPQTAGQIDFTSDELRPIWADGPGKGCNPRLRAQFATNVVMRKLHPDRLAYLYNM